MNRQRLAVYPIVDLPAEAFAGAAELVAAVLRGGATILQLRHKGELVSQLVSLAQQIGPWLAEAQVPLIINDRVEVALATGAQGVHLGQRDLPVGEARAVARRAARADLLIGVSVTTPEQARRAADGGADYLSVSPVFGTATKVDIERPVGLEGLRRIHDAVPDLPLVAIGGIRPAHAVPLVRAGADGVAFISAMSGAPESAVRAFSEAMRVAVLGRVDTEPQEISP